MSFDWNEYFYLAQEVAGLAPGNTAGQEARQRCAISRAYYAAFIRARNHLRFVDGDPQVPFDATAHVYVRLAFRRSRNRRRRQIAILLDNLRFARNAVDYDNAVPNVTANTTVWLAQAAQVLTILDSL